MPQTDQERVLALAALFQATSLVRNIAHQGQAEPEACYVCLASLLQIDPQNNAQVYGGPASLRPGLRSLCEQLQRPRDMEITRYIINLLMLERKLARRPDLVRQIRAGIEASIARLEHFSVVDEAMIADFAQLYTATISALTPRIMVQGNPLFLSNPDNQNRIRALLLAGIRAAILWRNSGGGRLTLLFRRNALLREGQRLLAATTA